jgi:hypothetical protein
MNSMNAFAARKQETSKAEARIVFFHIVSPNGFSGSRIHRGGGFKTGFYFPPSVGKDPRRNKMTYWSSYFLVV